MTVSTLVIFQDKSMEKNAACPSCGKKGRMVKPLTVESLLTEEARSRVIRADGFRFCAEPSCNVAYFHPETGDRFLRSEVRVRIGQKETAPPRPICYCFNHTVEEIESGSRRRGHRTYPTRSPRGAGRAWTDARKRIRKGSVA